jgi:hypothetical protein
MSELTGYTIFGASMIVIGAAFYAILVSAWRMMHDDGELRLERMLKRHGGRLDLAVGGLNTYQAALAVRRCVACPDKTECDAWLASGKRDGSPAFCPNTGFVQRIARET